MKPPLSNDKAREKNVPSIPSDNQPVCRGTLLSLSLSSLADSQHHSTISTTIPSSRRCIINQVSHAIIFAEPTRLFSLSHSFTLRCPSSAVKMSASKGDSEEHQYQQRKPRNHEVRNGGGSSARSSGPQQLLVRSSSTTTSRAL